MGSTAEGPQVGLSVRYRTDATEARSSLQTHVPPRRPCVLHLWLSLKPLTPLKALMRRQTCWPCNTAVVALAKLLMGDRARSGPRTVGHAAQWQAGESSTLSE